MRPSHRIRRQRWLVSTASPADAFALRSALRRENELSLLPVLESVFAEFDDARHDIHLPRLELRIRLSSVDRLGDELPARLAEAARQSLSAALASAVETPAATASAASPSGRLRHYLRTGQLAWFDAPREAAGLLAELTGEAGQWSASPDTAWPLLLASLPQDGPGRGSVFMRFLQLLDAGGRAAWSAFLAQLAARRGGDYPALLAALDQLQAGRPADHGLRLQALACVLLADGELGTFRDRAMRLAAMHACAAALGPLTAGEQRLWQRVELACAGNSVPAGPLAAGGPASPADAIAPDEREAWRPAAAPEPAPPVAAENAPGLPLRSAGLVLLHPFLPRLFAALGWIAAAHPVGQPFPPASLARAASLLHWLATGRDEVCEFELGTAKLLLGLSPDAALPVGGGLLGTAEREEGEALLAAVVEHWSALGKTSIDGLRLAFLQRSGLLYPAADGWLLRPQDESYDMLLERLPWGLSVIRLAWMPWLLHTDWSAR